MSDWGGMFKSAYSHGSVASFSVFWFKVFLRVADLELKFCQLSPLLESIKSPFSVASLTIFNFRRHVRLVKIKTTIPNQPSCNPNRQRQHSNKPEKTKKHFVDTFCGLFGLGLTNCGGRDGTRNRKSTNGAFAWRLDASDWRCNIVVVTSKASKINCSVWIWPNLGSHIPQIIGYGLSAAAAAAAADGFDLISVIGLISDLVPSSVTTTVTEFMCRARFWITNLLSGPVLEGSISVWSFNRNAIVTCKCHNGYLCPSPCLSFSPVVRFESFGSVFVRRRYGRPVHLSVNLFWCMCVWVFGTWLLLML